jgi:hypothetical protein
MPRNPVNTKFFSAVFVLTLALLTHASEAQAQAVGYVYAPKSYYVVPPTYYLGDAVFAPDPLLFPSPLLIPEPVVVRGPVVVSPPVEPLFYGGPVVPRAYKKTFRARPSGKHVYQERVYAPGRLGPVYEYDYRANPKRTRIRERIR